MTERTTKVTLSAQVQQYIAGMEQAARATRETGSEAEKLAQQTQALEQMGRASMMAGGLIAVGMGSATKAAIDWDSAWAGVTKTVDGSPEQLAAVEKGLRELTGVLPASHEEIAAVAEAAGQLGIETPNVVAFTRTMIDMGETTNLSSEVAATSLARFMTVMGTSQSHVSNLGSALVELGNNYATTEAEIMAMAMRLSGAGAQIGMSEGQVLGLSTALSSVGIEAEAGGSAMSKVMIDIASSVDKGGARLKQFADVAGVSADTFATKWKSDPGEALALFVKGLANAEAQGKSTFGILEELGITEVRMRDALLRSASAADQFSEAMATGNKAFDENTALASEAEKRYETVASKLSVAKNDIIDLAISLGDHLLPAVGAVADGVGNFADVLAGMDGPMVKVVAWGSVVAAGILLAGGAALAAVPKIAAYKVALETLNISTSGLRSGARSIAGFLTGPFGAAMLAAGVSVQVLTSAMDGSITKATEFENALKQGKSAVDVMVSGAAENEQGITKLFVDLETHFKDLPGLADKAAESGRGFFSSLTFGENAALDQIKEFGTSLQTLSSTNLPDAQKAFADFVEEGGLNETQALTFLNEEMQGFKSSLIDAAEAAGVATDDATLLKFAMGEVGPAAKAGAEGADAGSEALSQLEENAAQTQEAVSALADEIRGFGSTTFDMREANRSLEESYQALSDSLAENGNNFDISTEGGRANEAALDGVARAANEAAAAALMNGESQEVVNGKLAAGRDALIDMLAPYHGSRDAAAEYVDKLNLISPEKVTEIVAEAEDAKKAVDEFNSMQVPDKILEVDAETAAALEGIEGVNVKKIDDKTSYVYGNNKDADAKIQKIIDKNPAAKWVALNGNDAGFWAAWATIRDTPLAKTVSIVANVTRTIKETFDNLSGDANGAIYPYANGGIEAYANGGFPAGIYKGGTPIHKFAEPETLWEAYISGKPDQRDRNRQIWVETGERLGMNPGQQTVHVPTHVTVVDVDHKFIGTMQVVAESAVDTFVAQDAQASRMAGL